MQLHRVSSGDVLQMQDTRFSEILADLKERQNALALLPGTIGLGIVISLIAGYASGANSLFIGLALTLMASMASWWVDSATRSSVLMYDLDDEANDAYNQLTQAFDRLNGCAAKWHIDSGGSVSDIHA